MRGEGGGAEVGCYAANGLQTEPQAEKVTGPSGPVTPEFYWPSLFLTGPAYF